VGEAATRFSLSTTKQRTHLGVHAEFDTSLHGQGDGLFRGGRNVVEGAEIVDASRTTARIRSEVVK
jgi:hypothetical protein